jgi:hypothetical protein
MVAARQALETDKKQDAARTACLVLMEPTKAVMFCDKTVTYKHRSVPHLKH